MPRTVEQEVFTFDELSDSAKERARDWYREGALDYDWWNFVYEDAATCGKLLGIDINQKPVKLMDGSTRYDPSIWFRGFYTGQDGAAYDGTYSYAKGSVAAIRRHAPQDTDLHAIADSLQAVQRRHFYGWTASIKSNHGGDGIEVEVYDREGYDYAGDADGVIEPLRDFAHWIFKRLQAEYEWQMSDESVDESIRANEYEFTEEGARV